jgi:hypothetical protein
VWYVCGIGFGATKGPRNRGIAFESVHIADGVTIASSDKLGRAGLMVILPFSKADYWRAKMI